MITYIKVEYLCETSQYLVAIVAPYFVVYFLPHLFLCNQQMISLFVQDCIVPLDLNKNTNFSHIFNMKNHMNHLTQHSRFKINTNQFLILAIRVRITDIWSQVTYFSNFQLK